MKFVRIVIRYHTTKLQTNGGCSSDRWIIYLKNIYIIL